MTPFDRLNPALQHHIVNSLGWRSLRPLQEQAIDPLLAGDDALLLAPTAGGKTEAAVFPLLSRIMTEEWPAIGVLYVCPLRALLNNLFLRLDHYCRLVGRRVGLWHGDVGQAERRAIIQEPPDILLITPESLEVILIFRREHKADLFANVRSVIIDEIHAFAGDDRGWHLLSVLERISRHAGRELQRIGLSATVGEPTQLMGWLCGESRRPRRIIAPAADRPAEADVSLDFVGSTENAATVIARLHGGEKRLVFCDSRSRVEDLAYELRGHEVETFVSHGSLGREERRRAEAAFAQSTNCVIVATRTLELGIDVGDLDRVIQIEAPYTVAGFLQRLGRTGRRPDTRRNCLFLTTHDSGLLLAAGVLQLWGEGYVEPVVPPASPFHVLAQQIMALAMQEGGIGEQSWWEWLSMMPGFAAMPGADVAAVLDHMLGTQILFADNSLLWFGTQGEETFGRKGFMELLSVFTSDPLIAVRHGRVHLGEVDPTTFIMRHNEVPILLLGGRSWAVNHIDWEDRIAYVEPVADQGKSRWLSDPQPLHYRLCQAIRQVLVGDQPPGEISRRANYQLNEIRTQYPWVERDRTTVALGATGLQWWTFGGLCANAAIADDLSRRGLEIREPDNFAITISRPHEQGLLERAIAETRAAAPETMTTPIRDESIDDLKFSACLPRDLAIRELQLRLTDRDAIRRVLAEPVSFVTDAEG